MAHVRAGDGQQGVLLLVCRIDRTAAIVSNLPAPDDRRRMRPTTTSAVPDDLWVTDLLGRRLPVTIAPTGDGSGFRLTGLPTGQPVVVTLRGAEAVTSKIISPW